jgi:hypothetical protein
MFLIVENVLRHLGAHPFRRAGAYFKLQRRTCGTFGTSGTFGTFGPR